MATKDEIMAIKDEITARHVQFHDELSAAFYKKKRSVGVTSDEQAAFDTRHSQLWTAMDEELQTVSDYDPPPIPVPVRDLQAEIDELKAEVKTLKERM